MCIFFPTLYYRPISWHNMIIYLQSQQCHDSPAWVECWLYFWHVWVILVCTYNYQGFHMVMCYTVHPVRVCSGRIIPGLYLLLSQVLMNNKPGLFPHKDADVWLHKMYYILMLQFKRVIIALKHDLLGVKWWNIVEMNNPWFVFSLYKLLK